MSDFVSGADWMTDYEVTMFGLPEHVDRFEERDGTIYAFTPSDVWRRTRRGVLWGWKRVTSEEEPVRKVVEGSKWERWRQSTAQLNGTAPGWVKPLDS